jgi:hypothetical protein
MEGEMSPTPWLARRHAKEKLLIMKRNALRLGVWRGQNRTERGLTSVDEPPDRDLRPLYGGEVEV